MTSPPIWVVIAAASRTMPVASIRLKRAQPSLDPVSAIIAATNASAFASIAAAALLSKARRAFGPVSDQAGKAAPAASATARASATDRAGLVLAVSPVTGFSRAKVESFMPFSPPGARSIASD